MEYTEKLGLPIPEVTRGGDVNDVMDITTTIGDILNYLDSGSGDYLVRIAVGEAVENAEVSGNSVVDVSDVTTAMFSPPVEGLDPDKIGWAEDAESNFGKINEDGTITIKKGGTYSVIGIVFWTTEATDGEVGFFLDRDDLQEDINSASIFLKTAPKAQKGVYQVLEPSLDFNDVYVLKGIFGPFFAQEGSTITPRIVVAGSDSIEVGLINVALERL